MTTQISKTHDAAGRRLRDQRNPTGRILRKVEKRDLFWFEKLHRHGPLPSSFLRDYSVAFGFSPSSASDRLTVLYNEDLTPHRGSYLDRPWQQFQTIDARYNDLVYDLTDTSEQALKDSKLWRDNTPNPKGSWTHKFMVACATASIELECLKREGYRFIFGDEVLERANAKLRIPVTYQDPVSRKRMTQDLVPDGVFAIEYTKDGRTSRRLFLLECDRNTEPTRYYTFQRKSYHRSLLQYRHLIGDDIYKTHFALEATPVLVLHLTTNQKHMENLMQLLQEEFGGSNYQLFNFAPQFSRFFKPPKPLDHLFGPWLRVVKDDKYEPYLDIAEAPHK